MGSSNRGRRKTMKGGRGRPKQQRMSMAVRAYAADHQISTETLPEDWAEFVIGLNKELEVSSQSRYR